jgi:hypothetical protein
MLIASIAKALKGELKLPIVNWIYGGAYLMVLIE